MPKVLYILHNHPVSRPGGAEIYAHELYRSVQDGGEFEPTLVARVGPPQTPFPAHDGTRLYPVGNGDPNQYFFYTERDEFDRLLSTVRDKRPYTEDWRAFLRELEPDIVHIQHSAWLGYDIIRETRRTLPEVPIVYTLHEFLPVCHHSGVMVRTGTGELCRRASPGRCHQCFPEVSAQQFLLRERFIKSALSLVDMFIVPSEHEQRVYSEWGIPADRIRHENYGRMPVASLPDPPDAGRRRRLGFIGQLVQFKGVDVLLEAMKILEAEGAGVQLLLRGANLEYGSPQFQDRIRTLLEETAGSVTFAGSYQQSELPAVISAVDWVVVPSIWWETGPLVIHEALMHRRPVICSGIGSMAERIKHGVNGLHFPVGDAVKLAATIRRAVDSPELWDELRGNITEPHTMEEHLPVITGIYNDLLTGRSQRSAA